MPKAILNSIEQDNVHGTWGVRSFADPEIQCFPYSENNTN